MKIGLALIGMLAATPVRAERVGWSDEVDASGSPVLVSTTAVEPIPSTAAWVNPASSVGALKIVHPSEGAVLPAVKSSFVYGHADPNGVLKVNGKAVKIHPAGGWITMVPYGVGANTVEAELQRDSDTVRVVRQLTVGGPIVSSSEPVVQGQWPDQSVWVKPGERVPVQALGPPAAEGTFQVGSDHRRFSLVEVAGNGRGLYRGFYTVPDSGEMDNASVRFFFSVKNSWSRVTATAPGTIRRLDSRVPWVVEVSTPHVVLRASHSPGGKLKSGYIAFPPMGTRLLVTGRRGNEYRVALTSTREAWVGVGEVTDLPPSTLVPRAVASAISVDGNIRGAVVRLGLSARVPFEVRSAPDGRQVDILFFGAASDTDWIHYRPQRSGVTLVEWFQDETDVYRLRIHTEAGAWWGYRTQFDNGGFVLDLRRPPLSKGKKSLKGLRIAIDAGHSPDSGAVGPTEFAEKDANEAIALCLEKKLRRVGAEVFQVRRGTESVPLYDRPDRAEAGNADLLVSVHNNALPDGANPFERNGFGVYYFHPASFPLAQRVHEAYSVMFGPRGRGLSGARLKDDGLHYGNLALTRPSAMPSILTESAYMILPEEEDLLKTSRFQCDCAEAISSGIIRFVGDMQNKWNATP